MECRISERKLFIGYDLWVRVIFLLKKFCLFLLQKLRFAFERHPFAGGGMGEFEPAGVQIEPVGLAAVERVAEDGRGKAVGMCAVYAQLMGAARERTKAYDGVAVGIGAGNAVTSEGYAAVDGVYHLSRTVERVGTQG